MEVEADVVVEIEVEVDAAVFAEAEVAAVVAGVGVEVEDRTKVVSCPYEGVTGRWAVLTMLRNTGRVNPDLVLFSLLGVVELDVPLDGLRRLLAIAGSLG